MKTLHAVLIAALFISAACGSKKDEPRQDPPKTDPTTPAPAKADPAAGVVTVDEAGTRLTALMEKIGAAVTSAGGDCAKMGASLRLLIPAARATKSINEAIEKDRAKNEEFYDRYGDKLLEDLGKWLPAVEKCSANEDVKAFLAESK
jgi:hypothetical protein